MPSNSSVQSKVNFQQSTNLDDAVNEIVTPADVTIKKKKKKIRQAQFVPRDGPLQEGPPQVN